ncbi:fimbria/pilus outer membrane usher protein [Erwinia billingiae]|uniref:fimbria/pilus outer membrane usher protein n=1 Tax=Erwinia billingiae TaxID=182337 RepID=UPI00320B7336
MRVYTHSEKTPVGFRPSSLAMSIALLLSSLSVEARDFFNPALLEQTGGGGTAPDLSAFENGGQLPGRYPVDIYLNNEQVDSREVVFFQSEDQGLQPCLSITELANYGVRVEQFPGLQPAGDRCATLSAISEGSAEFVFSAHRLDLSVPQAALNPSIRGYVPPSQWDEGINAALLNYAFNGTSDVENQHGSSGNSQYLNLRPGANIGAWRIRNYSTWSRSSNGDDRWDTVYSYAQRSIVPFKSQLTLGESQAPSDVFDSVPFTGAQLASDDEMLPESLRGYAPVVRGVARGNSAQVIIRQNDYVIYQATVPAGPFEITDMFPTGGSGDLYVTVKESDGSEQHTIVPFASLPVLQREGHLRFSLTGGQYRAYDSSVDKAAFAQGTAIYGLGKGMTLYGGTQAADHYHSLAAGIGQNLGEVGAISVDITQSWGEPKDDASRHGQSWRVRYSKSLAQTGTNLTVAGYRYSTAGFYTLSDVLETYSDTPNSLVNERKRNRAELTLSQDLGGDRGYLSVGAINETYWNDRRKTASWNLGYNNSWNGISYSLNYAMNRNVTATGVSESSRGKTYERDQIFSLNLSIPLNRWMSNTYASYNVSSSKSRGTVNTVGLNGTALEDNNLSWNVMQGYGSDGQGSTGYASMNYRATYGEVNGGYSYASGQRTLNYGLQGAIVAHADGVTAGQSMGETFGLVKVPGASGVGVSNQTGVSTDYRGYALVPNLMPYRKNDITLKTNTLEDDVDLKQTIRTVVPTRGAVVRADYLAQVGQRVLMTLTRPNGKTVPFGATVVNEGDVDAGSSIVGDGGQVYLAGLQNKGTLLVQWGKGANDQCRVNYRLSTDKKHIGIPAINAQCR